jgi:hypothetical protein
MSHIKGNNCHQVATQPQLNMYHIIYHIWWCSPEWLPADILDELIAVETGQDTNRRLLG